MPELRWTLLILGALFIAALAWWEVRRQRQAPRQGPQAGQGSGADRAAPVFEGNGDLVRGHREPTISFADPQPETGLEPITASRARQPAFVPPVVEVDDASFARLDAGAERIEHDVAAMDAAVDQVSSSEAAATRRAEEVLGEHELRAEGDELDHEPSSAAIEVDALADTLETTAARETPDFVESLEGTAELERPAGLQALSRTAASASNGAAAHDSADASSPESAMPEPASTGVSAGVAEEPRPVGASAAGAPVVNWPGEENRKILALRLVSAPAARFPGRVVRQALTAEGFVLGKFDIFHKPGPDERAVLSAASLTKPGTFTLNSMDAQRFGGLSLFAVLPGPLPPQQAFDELLNTARNLNDRLQGALQDERGEPLTPVRSASIRQNLGGESTTGQDSAGQLGSGQ